MTKIRKSPQEKKELELRKDHFTFARHAHAFRKIWPRKKALMNRDHRRKGDRLLVQVKPGLSGEDAESATGEVTAGQIKKSANLKRLRKSGVVTVGQKVKLKLEHRQQTARRKKEKHRLNDEIAANSLSVLNSLEGEEFIDTVRRANRLILNRDIHERFRLKRSKSALDRALYFLAEVCFDNHYLTGNVDLIDSLRRNPDLCRQFWLWVGKSERILKKDQRAVQRKLDQTVAAEKKIKALARRERPI